MTPISRSILRAPAEGKLPEARERGTTSAPKTQSGRPLTDEKRLEIFNRLTAHKLRMWYEDRKRFDEEFPVILAGAGCARKEFEMCLLIANEEADVPDKLTASEFDELFPPHP